MRWLLAVLLALPMLTPAGAVACLDDDGVSIDSETHGEGHCGDSHNDCNQANEPKPPPPTGDPCDGCSDTELGIGPATSPGQTVQPADLTPIALQPALFILELPIDGLPRPLAPSVDPPPPATPLAHLSTVILLV